MRTLELALLLADLLAFVALAVQRLRALNRLGWAALAAPAVAAAQVVIEGSRWQMVPAYALSVLFPALWLRAPSPSRARGFASAALVVLGVLALLGAAALPAVFPVFRFPRPTGPYAIGTLTYHWIDSTRPEVFTADPSDRRELMVQLWYPARYQRGAARAPYVEHPETLQPLARLLGLPGFTLSYLDQVRTRAVDSAPAAGGPYPVLIFAHGRGGYRQHNTALVQELVSHGYVVAAMDQPGAASGVAFPTAAWRRSTRACSTRRRRGTRLSSTASSPFSRATRASRSTGLRRSTRATPKGSSPAVSTSATPACSASRSAVR
jgi:predicted dienelactone hydrolase